MTVKHRNCPVCDEKMVSKLQIVNNIDIVRCSGCKMVFADISNEEIESQNVYPQEIFDSYLASEPVYTLAYYDKILDKIKKHFGSNNLKILEFGCGPGFFLQRAKLKKIEAIGCDFSPYAEAARNKFDLNIVVKDIYNAGFKAGEFNVIITHATHEHLGNLLEISKQLVHLLKDNGLFIISGVPNYNTIPIRIFRSFLLNMPPSHVNFFEKRSLKQLYKRLNLQTLSIKSYGLGVWVWSLMMFLKNIRNKQSFKQLTPAKKTMQIEKEVKIRSFHKFITWIYVNFHIPNLGRNLEIWGVKK